MKLPINDIKPNPDNPRIIKDEKFKQLVKSIQDFPQMLELRPIVINSDNMVLGGNMRLKACKEAGMTEVSVVRADSLTEEQQRRFIITDNVGFGDWNWPVIVEQWPEAAEWGLDIPEFDDAGIDMAEMFSGIGGGRPDDVKQITFILQVEEINKLTSFLKTFDKNKDKALSKFIQSDICSQGDNQN